MKASSGRESTIAWREQESYDRESTSGELTNFKRRNPRRQSVADAVYDIPAELQDLIKGEILKVDEIVCQSQLLASLRPDPSIAWAAQISDVLRPQCFKRFLEVNVVDASAICGLPRGKHFSGRYGILKVQMKDLFEAANSRLSKEDMSNVPAWLRSLHWNISLVPAMLLPTQVQNRATPTYTGRTRRDGGAAKRANAAEIAKCVSASAPSTFSVTPC